MDGMQADLTKLEKENTELKEKLRKMGGFGLGKPTGKCQLERSK